MSITQKKYTNPGGWQILNAHLQKGQKSQQNIFHYYWGRNVRDLSLCLFLLQKLKEEKGLQATDRDHLQQPDVKHWPNCLNGKKFEFSDFDLFVLFHISDCAECY